jgi:hypothetical protein
MDKNQSERRDKTTLLFREARDCRPSRFYCSTGKERRIVLLQVAFDEQHEEP